MTEDKARMRVIDRCIKRRRSRRPADVVDRISVPGIAWADAVIGRMKAAGYDPRPKHPGEPRAPKPMREVSLSVTEFWHVMADALAAEQGISAEQFMAAILQEGLFEAFLEMQAQRRNRESEAPKA
jgi:hypothetical protein